MAYPFFFTAILTLNVYYVFSKSKTEKNSKIVFISSTILVLILSAFRYNIGYDFERYVLRIHEMPLYNQIKLARELFSYILLWLSYLMNNTQFYFVINSLVTISLISYTIYKESIEINLSLWIFVCFPLFYLNSFSIVRNFSAASIVFYSTKYIFSNDLKKFLICLFIATMFHNAAILAAPLYFIGRFKLSVKSILGTVLLAFIGKSFFQKFVAIFLPAFSRYVMGVEDVTSGGKTIIVLIFILVLCVPIYSEMSKSNKNTLYVNSLFFGVLVYLLFLKHGTFSYRSSMYYYMYIIILIPELIGIYSLKYPKIKILLNLSTYLLFLIMFIYMIKVGGKSYYPYQSIFSKHI